MVGGIDQALEKAAAMGSRSQTRRGIAPGWQMDTAYVSEYRSYQKHLREARSEAEAKGVVFDEASVLRQLRKGQSIDEPSVVKRRRPSRL